MATRTHGVGVRNTTGAPDTKEYHLGGGRIFLAELQTNGKYKAFREIGNCPSFTVTTTSETYDHDSVMGAVATQDASVAIRAGASVGFTLENLNAENLADFFLGEATTYTNPLASAQTATPLILNANIEKERWYQVQDASGNPVFGITSTNALTLKSGDGLVTLVADTDYTVDATMGMIFLKDTSTVDTVIAKGTADGDIDVSWTLDASVTAVDQVKGMTDTTKNFALHLHSINGMDNSYVTKFAFHKISLTPDGDLGMITQEAAQMPFTGKVESNSAFTNDFDIYAPTDQD